MVGYRFKIGVRDDKMAEDCTPICVAIFRKVCFPGLFFKSFESYRGSR